MTSHIVETEPGVGDPLRALRFELYSTSFCGACKQTRMALGRVLDLIPGATLAEYDVALHPDRAESLGIEHSPTTIIRDAHGVELSRATGVPSVPQVLVLAARAAESVAQRP